MITCVVCRIKVKEREISQYAAFSGLPSPCWEICFSVNDYSIKSIEELAVKSLLERVSITEKKED